MNSKTTLYRLLVASLLTTGCGLLDDLGGGKKDTDGMSESSGDDGDDDEGDDDGSDGHNDSHADGPQDGGEAADDSEGDGPSEDSGDEAADESGSASDGGACVPDTTACIDDATISVCVEGEMMPLDCYDACIELGYLGSFGCGFDEEAGIDLCFCDDGSGGEGGSEGGA